MALPPPRDLDASIDALVAELARLLGVQPTVDTCAARWLSGCSVQLATQSTSRWCAPR